MDLRNDHLPSTAKLKLRYVKKVLDCNMQELIRL